MEFKIIEYGTPEHKQMLNLRYEILRKPINSIPTEEELAEDENYILLGAFCLETNEIAACCFLSHLDGETARLRQMAVDTPRQGRGLGKELVKFAETIARENHYKYMYLHARKTAILFYEKLGYEIEGDEFMEVGIPHFAMRKRID